VKISWVMTGLALAVLSVSAANASVVQVVNYDQDTQGLHTAGLFIQWKDGFNVEFAVRFDMESITGLELLQTVETQTDLVVTAVDSTWGVFIDGLAYQGHSNQGFGGGEDWWHYWVQNGDATWAMAATGVSDRRLYDGYRDGWVYGQATIPEPATLALLALGTLLARRRRSVQ